MKMNRNGFTLIELMIAVAILGLILAIAIPAFNQQREIARDQKEPVVLEVQEVHSKLMNGKAVGIQDYGSGVYKFSAIGDEFREVLANFLKTHPDLEVVAISDDVTHEGAASSSYGATTCHTVVCRQKAKP